MRHIKWQLFSFRCAFNVEHGRTPEPRTPHVCPKSKVMHLCTLFLSSPPGTKLPIQRQSQAHRRHTERAHFIWWKIIKTYLFLNTISHFRVLFFKSLWIMDGHYIQILTAWSAGEKIIFSKNPIP